LASGGNRSWVFTRVLAGARFNVVAPIHTRRLDAEPVEKDDKKTKRLNVSGIVLMQP
jgi:hypothetical protein